MVFYIICCFYMFFSCLMIEINFSKSALSASLSYVGLLTWFMLLEDVCRDIFLLLCLIYICCHKLMDICTFFGVYGTINLFLGNLKSYGPWTFLHVQKKVQLDWYHAKHLFQVSCLFVLEDHTSVTLSLSSSKRNFFK